MTRECDVLGQLDGDDISSLQVNLVLPEGSDYAYHKSERLLEATSGKVGVQIPEGYVAVWRTSTNKLKSRVYTRTDLNEENGVWIDEGDVLGLIRLEPLDLVETFNSKE